MPINTTPLETVQVFHKQVPPPKPGDEINGDGGSILRWFSAVHNQSCDQFLKLFFSQPVTMSHRVPSSFDGKEADEEYVFT